MLQDANGLLQMMVDSCVNLVQQDDRISLRPPHQLRLMANLALFLRYYRQGLEANVDADNDPVNYIGECTDTLYYTRVYLKVYVLI